MNRNKEIIKVSYQGIIINTILVIFKIIVGLISGSIAIILDGINNLADAVSSIITIIGTKLSQSPADKEHPFGHGRIEYITSVIIAVLILFTAFTSLNESIQKVITPSETDYSWATLLVLGAAVIIKLVFGYYQKRKGAKLNSQSLSASGADSLLDSIVSLSTLISALIFIFYHIDLDGILGVVISILIFKTGYDIIKESLGSIIGARTDSKLATDLQAEIEKFPEVEGAYDLILHDYGPNEMIGAIHIEVNDHMTAKEIDDLSRKIVSQVFRKYGILLTIGIYATNTTSQEIASLKKKIREYVDSLPYILQMHGFYINEKEKHISFDVVIDFKDPDPKNTVLSIRNELHKRYPKYSFEIFTDNDFSDSFE